MRRKKPPAPSWNGSTQEVAVAANNAIESRTSRPRPGVLCKKWGQVCIWTPVIMHKKKHHTLLPHGHKYHYNLPLFAHLLLYTRHLHRSHNSCTLSGRSFGRPASEPLSALYFQRAQNTPQNYPGPPSKIATQNTGRNSSTLNDPPPSSTL